MRVLFAYYGVSCAKGNLRKSVQRLSTKWAARLCNGKTKCGGRVTNSNLMSGGCLKDYYNVYRCGKVLQWKDYC